MDKNVGQRKRTESRCRDRRCATLVGGQAPTPIQASYISVKKLAAAMTRVATRAAAPPSRRPAPEVLLANDADDAAGELAEASTELDTEEPVPEDPDVDEDDDDDEGAAPSAPFAAAMTVLLNVPVMFLSSKRAENDMTGYPLDCFFEPSRRIK